MSWYDNLNELQRTAVASTSPNVAVIAGAGTGKTRTLVGKALQLIQEEVAPPDRVRIVTFTRAGVYDLRKKVASDPAYSAIRPESASTFHSLALQTLRKAGAPSLASPLVVLDDWEEETFIDQLAKLRLGIKDIRIAERRRKDYNSRWCIASDTADQWLSEGDRRQYEAVYNLAKDLLGFTTRGELTFLWWRYLRANPAARHVDLAFPWTHLLVDEYQDLNECEHDILQYLARAGVSVFAVGDPNQSIYETMRHAHPEFCWEFRKRVAPGELHVLRQSYRCPSEILLLGQALLGSAPGVPDPSLARSKGEAHMLWFPVDTAERSGLARFAEHLLCRYPESRVLLAVPTRSLGHGFVAEFAPLVPVEDRVSRRAEAPEECRLARALLRLLKNPKDGVAAATAIILKCPASTRAERVGQLVEAGEQAGTRIADVLTSDVPLPGPLADARRRTNEMLDLLRNSGPHLPETLRQLTGCGESAGDADQLEARMQEVLAQTEQLEPGKVTIMTVHASKGTEAEWVIIPAVEPGPFERGYVGAPKEERRRLLYVGMTRAINGLFLSFSARRYRQQRYADPTGPSFRKGASVFIDEIYDRTGRHPESGTEFLRDHLG